MQVIISHVNTDFDALASMLAAKKLFPEATIVLSDKQETKVRHFLNIYRDTLEFSNDKEIEWENIRHLILVDVASLTRIGGFINRLQENNIKITVFDHHPSHEKDVTYDDGIVEPVGAAVTLLLEEIRRQSLPISPFEATIFGLGIYTDTGSFTYNTTTKRDFEAASYLMDCGMNLDMVQRFSEQSLLPEQQQLLDELFIRTETIDIDGLTINLSTYEQDKFQNGLAILTQRLLEMKGADASISIVKMKNHVYIVGRATAERIHLQPLLKLFGGGGHRHAGSAMIKQGDLETTISEVKRHLRTILQPATTARQIMAHPVKTLSPETTIEEAGKLMYRYGHSGYPIVDRGKLVGIITRRDLDKANHHGLGHAPVKAYMSTQIVSITPEMTIEEIQKIIIQHNIGRLPVVEEGKLIGIVTRTNIIEEIHRQSLREDSGVEKKHDLQNNIKELIEEQLPEEINQILQKISQVATELKVPTYLVGGIVRDILLRLPNDDVDIVVEGDGITFAEELHEQFGGEVLIHESFGTATWEHPTGFKIDIASSRLEYYDRPASLPDVEGSTLSEDLYRRDFTINAMAVCLNETNFGHLVDPFSGQIDLYNRSIKVLHNLSFVEDPTRILRAIRFEIRFRFKMDAQTETLALHSIEKMQDVSPVRILDEIKRMFTEEDPLQAIQRLYDIRFWPQYTKDYSSHKRAIIVAKKLKHLLSWAERELKTKSTEWFTYFLIPFFVSEQPDVAKTFALRKSERKIIEETIFLMNEPFEHYNRPGDFQRRLKGVRHESVLLVTALKELPGETIIKQYLINRNNIPVYITGSELKNYNLKPGPIYKDILQELEVAILNGEIHSKADAEIWLKQYINNLK